MVREDRTDNPHPDDKADLQAIYDDTLAKYGLVRLLVMDIYAKRQFGENKVNSVMEGVDNYNRLSLEEKIDFVRQLGEERREALRKANELA